MLGTLSGNKVWEEDLEEEEDLCFDGCATAPGSDTEQSSKRKEDLKSKDFMVGPVAFGRKVRSLIHGLRSENRANKHAGPPEANQNAGTEDSIDAGDSEKEDESTQVLLCNSPIGSSYSSTIKDPRARMQLVIKNLRKEFAQETENFLIQVGAAKASSTNIVNTVSTPVSTASPMMDYPSLIQPILNMTCDSEIPHLEDIYQNPTNGIFTNSSYDDEGAVADFTNLDLWNVNPIPTSRINSFHPSTLILGDPKSAVQTRSKVTKSSGAHAFMSSMGELTFFLGLQVKQKADGIFISQDKYVAEILKKFDFVNVKTASTPMEDPEALAKGMCKPSHSKDLPSKCCQVKLFRKSTTGGCQFLGRRLILAMKSRPCGILLLQDGRICAVASYKQLENVPVPLDHFPMNALTSKVFSFMVKKGKHFLGKVTPLFASMLVQPTEDEGAPSESPSKHKHTPYSSHQGLKATIDPQSDPSPRPSPSTTILDSLLGSSGGNHGGQSSSDISLSGNEGDMTLQSVYDLCISLCTQVSDQAKVIQHLKAQIKKLKREAKLSLYVSKTGRVSAKAEPSVHKDPLFDEIPEDTLDYMETEDAQDVGRTRDVVDEEKENVEDVLSTKDVLSTAQQKVSTDKEKVSTNRPIDDETIAQVLLNMSQAKAVSREKEKGVDFFQRLIQKSKGKKIIEEEDESEIESDGEEERKRLVEEEATNDALIRNYDDIKARIKADRLLAEKLQEEEREQFTIEERAKFLHDTIAAQRKFLCFNKDQSYRGGGRNFKHSDLKTKKFEEIQALYEKIKRSDEDFISIGSAEDERLIKKMNEKGIDSFKNESVKEEDKEEEGTKKRKGGHIKMIARKKKRSQLDVDSDDKHKKYLKIVTFESILDSEIMEKKSVIARLNKVSSPDRDYLVIYRANGNFRAFNYLIKVLHIFDRQDLFHLYDLMREQYSEVTLYGFELILWGDLKIMMESSTEGNEQVIHLLVERRYPLSKDLLQRMLDLGLEVERESSVALDLIRFIKQRIDEE
ncbi:putative ribonuclease H-like domain-containing protein [Tanacetum coccineum]|uniref:Ribonuclease H-like domain-containing protein n=1 Tax=Tanacetum coccineum TaxID=301880 RepID=A0ABQ5IY21_9ASTR